MQSELEPKLKEMEIKYSATRRELSDLVSK